jgi:hypothetical protein
VPAAQHQKSPSACFAVACAQNPAVAFYEKLLSKIMFYEKHVNARITIIPPQYEFKTVGCLKILLVMYGKISTMYIYFSFESNDDVLGYEDDEQ